MKTVLVLVLAALCAAQIYSASAAAVSTNGLLDNAQTLLDQLLSDVRTTITDAISNIQNLLNPVIQLGTSTLDGLEAGLNKTLTNLLGPVNDLVEKAADLGVDVTNCTKQLVPVLNTPGNLITGVETCVNGITNEAQGLANNTIDSVTGTLEQVTDLQNIFKNCQNGGLLGLLGCLTDLISKILGAITSIPNTITGLVSGLGDQLTDLKPAISQCTSGIVDQLSSSASPVINDVITCINDAISAAGNGAAPPS